MPPEPPKEILVQALRLKDLLHDVSRLRAVLDPLEGVSREGLAPHHLQALWWLRTEGLLSVNLLARRLRISVPKCTRVLDRLEDQDLAWRGRSEDDRRVARIHLSEKGRVLAEQLDRTAAEKMARLLQPLEPGDREALLRIVERLRHSTP